MDEITPPSNLSRRSVLKSALSLALFFPGISALAKQSSKKPKWSAQYEAVIQVEIASQDGFRVHRPYVAVWIEDKDGKSVRTISLWVQTTRRGPKWIPDLRRWYRGEQARAEIGGGDLVYSTSSATRDAGVYTLVWDGKNDKGSLVDQGEYSVCIEAVREHGTYQLIVEKLKFGTKPFKQQLAGNVEIKGASVELRKRK